MAYQKIDQSPFVFRSEGEIVVELDTGDAVAVRVLGSVEPNTGNTALQADARAVAPDGSDRLDANGQRIATGYTFSADTATVAALGGMAAFKRLMLQTVLGESPAWPNAPAADALEHASIRTNLAAALHAGPAADVADLL